MKRSYLLRRPADEDDVDYNYGEQELVRAKPIDARLARNLGPGYSGGKDFVKGSEKSQKEFYGGQMVETGQGGSGAGEEEAEGPRYRPMTHDERNKISASIIKAELKGDMDRVRKLKRKIEDGVVEIEAADTNHANESTDQNTRKEVLLMSMDKRGGLVMPVRSQQAKTQIDTSTTTKKGTVDTEYEKEMDINQMVAEEKTTTAEQQIAMFNRSAKICSESRVDDDWVVDDNMMSHPKKRRHDEKEARRKAGSIIKEHKFVENTLGSCPKCIDSRHLEKHAIVATGIKTYLAVVNWDGLSPDHCYISPMAHYASSVVMDEDVYEEMKLWMKGLVAMWRDDPEEEQDCVFVESALNVRQQQHMYIECIPIPKEIGEMAPIYFKKAIMESEKEWSDNKKLIDLSKSCKAGVRGAIPKEFPYFAVNFGLQPGFAHVVENEEKFPTTFAQEIVGGMLDLPHHHWRNPKRQTFDKIVEKRNRMQEKWAKYDWTEIVKRELKMTTTGNDNEEEDDGGDGDKEEKEKKEEREEEEEVTEEKEEDEDANKKDEEQEENGRRKEIEEDKMGT